MMLSNFTNGLPPTCLDSGPAHGEALRLARRLRHRLAAPEEDSVRDPEDQHTERDDGPQDEDRHDEREDARRDRAEELDRGDEWVPEPAGRERRLETREDRRPLDQPRCTATRDESQ